MLNNKEFWNSRAKSFRRYEGKRDEYANNIFDTMDKHGVVLKGASVLDLGCGSGGFAIGMAKEGAVVTAMDISSEMLKIAAEDAAANGVDIKFIESNWDEYKGDEHYDIIFCSLTPAIHDDTSREKLLAHADRHIVYLGFMPDTGDDEMAGLYELHNTKPRLMVGATEMHDWLDSKNITQSTYPFKKYRKSVKSKEDMIKGCVCSIEATGAKADPAIIESYIERFKTSDDMYSHNGYNNVDMIIVDLRK